MHYHYRRRPFFYEQIEALISDRAYSCAEIADELGCNANYVRKVIIRLQEEYEIDTIVDDTDERRRRYQIVARFKRHVNGQRGS